MPFLVTFQKLAVEKGAAKDAADMKEKGKKMAGITLKWIKAHFDELQFYSLETYIKDGADIDEVCSGELYCADGIRCRGSCDRCAVHDCGATC